MDLVGCGLPVYKNLRKVRKTKKARICPGQKDSVIPLAHTIRLRGNGRIPVQATFRCPKGRGILLYGSGRIFCGFVVPASTNAGSLERRGTAYSFPSMPLDLLYRRFWVLSRENWLISS